MAYEQLELIDGPDKPALHWALAYPDEQFVHFKTADDAIDAEVRRIEELSDAFSFNIEGVARSGAYNGRAFHAIYSVERRSGTLVFDSL